MSKDSDTQTSAPGRVILFGEHAHDHGHPAVGIAVDMRARCSVSVSDRFAVDGEELDGRRHAYIRAALLNGWTDMDKPIALTTGSDIPPELGLGGLAAGTVASLGAMSMIHDHIIFGQVASNAFQAHCEVDASSNPLDTCISTFGGCVTVTPEDIAEPLWKFGDGKRRWFARGIRIPEMSLILGYSGTPSPEADMKLKVERYCQRNSFAREIISDIGRIAAEGAEALARSDPEEVGRLMTRNHRLLANLGVSTPALEKLVQAAARHSYGAKLTGYGGGGCMLALARDPEKTVQAIEAAGGRAVSLEIAEQGLRPDD